MGLLDTLGELDAALAAGRTTQAILLAARLRAGVARQVNEHEALATEAARSRLLLERTLRVSQASGLSPVAAELVDTVMAIVGARRGFLGLVTPTGWTILTARAQAQADIDQPEKQVSTTIIRQVIATGEAVVTSDAAGELDAGSVHSLRLRSVACLPLQHQGQLLGFVYLDDPATAGLFDEPALAAVRAWLPQVAVCVARARDEPTRPAFPEVLTRSPRLQALVDELAQVARFDIPVLLTGETGTGKGLLAREIHAHSPRAGGPFVHLNCGAIPEALLEAELFGAEAGAYTGARTRRIGKFEAARGGTLFLDELDAMPMPCQVKLLVALQERSVTRLGSHAPIPVDVRVIAAMGSEPARAIAEARLREDLYYRLAVFVARLPALRERKEDVPLLARHVMERTRKRYKLPALRLTALVEKQLLLHHWPGNVRELENVLDRAALLARDGTIRELVFPDASPATVPRGTIRLLQAAAAALVERMLEEEPLRDLGLTRAFTGAVLLDLAGRVGRSAAFELLGRGHEVRSHNDARTFQRELARLDELAAQLGEVVEAPHR